VNKKHDIRVSVKDNRKEYDRQYRILNKEHIKEYNQFREKKSKESKRKRKQEIIIYKGGKCERCGLSFDGENECVFDFHHPGDKLFMLASYSKSMEELYKEADKCELLCAACHRLLHKNNGYGR
jgi:hypothetical protein